MTDIGLLSLISKGSRKILSFFEFEIQSIFQLDDIVFYLVTFLGFWETVNVQGFIPPGSASHGVAIWKDSMFVIAGESYNRASFMYVYDFNGKSI